MTGTVAAGALAAVLVTGCSQPKAPLTIVNDQRVAVTLAACVDDPAMNVVLSPGATFRFSDSLGRRPTPDDPGFSCVLKNGSRLLCLELPTDQRTRSVFLVSQARSTSSSEHCFARSDPH